MNKETLVPPEASLAETHRGFRRVFQPGRLTLGFIAPLEGYRS